MMQTNLILERAATEFREKNGIGSSEPIRFKSWLQKLGVIVSYQPFSGSFSGMALKHGIQKSIVINSSHSVGKQHFTLAHEIYHLFIQADFKSEISYTGSFDKKNKTEYDADCFAAYLIMPEIGVKSLIPENELGKNKITLSTIVTIEQFFSCSRTALLYRLSEMGLIDFKKYETYKTNVIKSALLLGFDDKLYLPGNESLVIGDYGVRAKKLLDNDKISESHYISLMQDIGINVTNLEEENGKES